MTIAEQLREDMAQSVVFDRDKVIEAVKNGIRHNGVAYVTYYGFGYTQGIIYRSTEKAVVILRRYGGLLSMRLALGFLTVGTVTWTDAITSLRP